MPLTTDLLHTVESQWKAMLAHPFLQRTANGTLPPGRFETWLQQDYLFIRAEIGVIGSLLAQAPQALPRLVGQFIPALYGELALFETVAQERGITLEHLEPAPVCHAYSMFLLATAHTCSFVESFAVLYGVERAYYDSWTQVKAHQTRPSPYQRLIDQWSGESFAAAVHEVEQALDQLGERCGEAERARMDELMRLTVRYEYVFWDLALNGGEWPV